jgi:eukaryotic-like serine/threonine-protein kinase
MPELCLKVVTEPPRPLSEFRPDVPPAVVAIIERCLAKEPAGRYANASELAAALEPFAPPLMSRVAADRPRTTLIAAPTPGPSVDMARPTLPSAEPSPVASGPTPSAWGGAPGNSPGEHRRSRVAVPLVAALLIGVTVAAGVLLARRSAGVGAAASSSESTPMSPATPPPAALPAAGPAAAASQADIAPAASIAALAETSPSPSAQPPSAQPPSAQPPSAQGRTEPSFPKRETPPSPPRPVVLSGAAGGGASSRMAGTGRVGVPDDDIPALR